MARGQLGIGQAGEAREQRRDQKRNRRVQPGRIRDLADQHIDTGAKDGAQAVKRDLGQRQRSF